MNEDTEPRYMINVAARMLGIQSHTLRRYEKISIIKPSRSRRNIRLYSERDIAQLGRVKTLVNDLGVNLAGVEIILHMMQRMTELQQHMEELESELARLKQEE